MRGSVAGTLRELRAGAAQVPADELADQAGTVVSHGGGGGYEVVPKVLFEPDASDLVGLLVRHGHEAYVPYVRCRYGRVARAGQIHSCIVCPLYVRFKSLSSRNRHITPFSHALRTGTQIQEIA